MKIIPCRLEPDQCRAVLSLSHEEAGRLFKGLILDLFCDGLDAEAAAKLDLYFLAAAGLQPHPSKEGSFVLGFSHEERMREAQRLNAIIRAGKASGQARLKKKLVRESRKASRA